MPVKTIRRAVRRGHRITVHVPARVLHKAAKKNKPAPVTQPTAGTVVIAPAVPSQPVTAPSVPVILNVHFPHNVPRNQRCMDLGRAITKAIGSFDGYKRVAVMASGGLTHFVVDEDLDKKVLTAMETGDEAALVGIPENYFKVGTAEIKNWYPVIAAMNAAGKKYNLVDYVPCYRSEAGTGCSMGFVYWE